VAGRFAQVGGVTVATPLKRDPLDGGATIVRLYLTWSSIPELADLPKDRRMRTWRHAFPRALFHPISLLVCVAGSFAFGEFTDWLVVFTGSRWWAALIGVPLAGMLGLLYSSFVTHRARPSMAAFLAREERNSRPAA